MIFYNNCLNYSEKGNIRSMKHPLLIGYFNGQFKNSGE